MASDSSAERTDAMIEQARSLATELGEALRAAGRTVATAESCTGGLVGSILTDIAGSSDYVLGGVISYSNEAKRDLLGVPGDALERFGAVSEPVARAMAEGAKRVFGTDYAVSTTGIAGPAGGTAEKPVGLVYIGVATPSGVRVERFVWGGNRLDNKAESALAALRMLHEAISIDASG